MQSNALKKEVVIELSIDFLEFRTWFLSTPMSLNANTPALEMKKNEKSERSIYSH